jgi:hypothetical protein
LAALVRLSRKFQDLGGAQPDIVASMGVPMAGAGADDLLRPELLAMRDEDRKVARASFQASEADERFRGRFLFEVDVDRSEWPTEFFEAEAVVARHAVRLREIVALHGWPGASLVGPDGADAAWLVLQHSDRDLQEHCLPLLRTALGTGEATAQQYAAVADRIELLAGVLQLYGTHLALDDQGRHVPTRGVVEPGGLDRRRAAIGLEAWSGYVLGMGGRPGPTGSSESRDEDESL